MDFNDTKSVMDSLALATSTPLINEAELKACFRLRHDYFVRQRGWVAKEKCQNEEETDVYDPHAFHLSVSENEAVTAYLRVLPFDPTVGFMLDHELSDVLCAEARIALPRDKAVELSRLVCRERNNFQEPQNGRHPMEHLFKQFYHLSLRQGFNRFYIVVETSWLRLFARRFGLSFRVLGQPHTFPDGTQTVAAVATLEELEAGIRNHNPAKFQWYCEPL
jgi:N-acyl-L-homoserine lactone synthetase